VRLVHPDAVVEQRDRLAEAGRAGAASTKRADITYSTGGVVTYVEVAIVDADGGIKFHPGTRLRSMTKLLEPTAMVTSMESRKAAQYNLRSGERLQLLVGSTCGRFSEQSAHTVASLAEKIAVRKSLRMPLHEINRRVAIELSVALVTGVGWSFINAAEEWTRMRVRRDAATGAARTGAQLDCGGRVAPEAGGRTTLATAQRQ